MATVLAGDYRHTSLAPSVERRADPAAPDLEAYLEQRETALLQRQLPRLFPRPVNDYVDLGCGVGRITRLVAPHARHAIGIDTDAVRLEQARRDCPQVRFLCGDVLREPMGLHPADLVSLFGVAGVAPPEATRELLGAARGLLRDGGRLLLSHRQTGDGLDDATLCAQLEAENLAVEQAWGIGWWMELERLGIRARPHGWLARTETLSCLGSLARWCPARVVLARAV